MDIKSKVELKEKGSTAALPTIEGLLCDLLWQTEVDLDAMAFIEKKDGSTTAIVTDAITKDPKTMGDLNTFPFMNLSGDAGIGGAVADGGNKETIRIAKIDPDVSKVRIGVFNYTDRQKSNATFKPYNAKVQIVNEKGEAQIVELNSDANGCFAHIATIEQTPIGATIKNESEVYSLEDFINKVPGASILKS